LLFNRHFGIRRGHLLFFAILVYIPIVSRKRGNPGRSLSESCSWFPSMNYWSQSKPMVQQLEDTFMALMGRNTRPVQGCQTFLGPNLPKWEKYTKGPQTIPNVQKLYPLALKYLNSHKI
jgi:hypothetical protein